MNKIIKRHALISSFDKKKLYKICKVLKLFQIKIIATESTAKHIRSIGYDCSKISSITKFKEILGGRVKTLHPLIHGSLLYKRNNNKHFKEIKKYNFPIIDFVIVDLYPFKDVVKKNLLFDEVLEMIDIGGTAMLRSASKNFESITTLAGDKHYDEFTRQLKKNNGSTTIEFRKKMAIYTFKTISEYDLKISDWLNDIKRKKCKKEISLKYGENPNQTASYSKNLNQKSIFEKIINNQNLSYNNILDINSGMHCIKEFSEPSCVIIKHTNPCGVASSTNIKLAYVNALKCDPISAFGGIAIFNRTIDGSLSKSLFKKYLNIVCAPQFTKDALNILKKKKNLIIVSTKNIHLNKNETSFVLGGIIKQEVNNAKIVKKNIIAVNKFNINNSLTNDLLFALKVCKHVKSNAIVIVKNKRTLGIGAGQMSRIDATKISLSKISKNKTKSFVAASDGFFPFNDSIKLLKKFGCKALITPFGSKNDNNLIKYAKKNNINLFFSKGRFFKH